MKLVNEMEEKINDIKEIVGSEMNSIQVYNSRLSGHLK